MLSRWEPLWLPRLIRCELDLDADMIRFYALRRRDPGHHCLLRAAACVRSMSEREVMAPALEPFLV
jgi:hypothetical protein